MTQQIVAPPINSSGETVSRQNQIKSVSAETGPAYWGPGNKMTFLATGKETDGAFFLPETSVPPGGGPPPHIHSPRGRIVPPPRRRADDSGGRGFNPCIGWRFCFPSSWNRTFLQELRRCDRESSGVDYSGWS